MLHETCHSKLAFLDSDITWITYSLCKNHWTRKWVKIMHLMWWKWPYSISLFSCCKEASELASDYLGSAWPFWWTIVLQISSKLCIVSGKRDELESVSWASPLLNERDVSSFSFKDSSKTVISASCWFKTSCSHMTSFSKLVTECLVGLMDIFERAIERFEHGGEWDMDRLVPWLKVETLWDCTEDSSYDCDCDCESDLEWSESEEATL